MAAVKHLTMDELEAGLNEILHSPKEEGVLKLIVRRPHVDVREVIEIGVLDQEFGLVGDGWYSRGSAGGSANMEAQLTLMNSRVIDLLAQDKERWELAGDQLFVDLDLSKENLPPGTRLELGSAVVEVTALPHTGCNKFVSRFGMDAMNFVNSPRGKQLNLRGIYTKVVQAGTIRVGDVIRKHQ